MKKENKILRIQSFNTITIDEIISDPVYWSVILNTLSDSLNIGIKYLIQSDGSIHKKIKNNIIVITKESFAKYLYIEKDYFQLLLERYKQINKK